MAYKFNPFTGKLEEYGPVLTGTGTVSAAADGTAATPGIAFANDLNTGIYSPGADQVAISTNGTGRLFVDSSGRLGLGTSNPQALLDLYSTGNTTLRISGSSGGGSDVSQIDFFRIGSNVSASLKALRGGGNSEGQLAFYTATSGTPTEKVRIDSSGRLLVGTSSTGSVLTKTIELHSVCTNAFDQPAYQIYSFPGTATSHCGYFHFFRSRGSSVGTNTIVASGDRLGMVRFAGANGTGYDSAAEIYAEVDGTPGASGDMPGRLVFSTTADGASSPTERMRIDKSGLTWLQGASHNLFMLSAQGAGTTYAFLNGRHSSTGFNTGTTSFWVYTNGNVQNTNNSYGAISDAKLKENIVDANSQWNDLKALQVRNYNFKEGQTHTQIGLIAQEVEIVSPGLVSESPDRDTDGNDLGTVTKSVNYSVLYMKAVKALQEAMERIETLEAKVAALEAS